MRTFKYFLFCLVISAFFSGKFQSFPLSHIRDVFLIAYRYTQMTLLEITLIMEMQQRRAEMNTRRTQRYTRQNSEESTTDSIGDNKKYNRVSIDYWLSINKKRVRCNSISALNTFRDRIKEKIVNLMEKNSKTGGKLKYESEIALKMMSLVENPGKEAFNKVNSLIIRFIKSYVPEEDQELTGSVEKLGSIMENIYSKLDAYLEELIENSKKAMMLNWRNPWYFEELDLSITFRDFSIAVKYPYLLNLVNMEIFLEKYKDDAPAFGDINKMKTLLGFFVANFENLILNLFHARKYRYCMQFGSWDIVQIFSRAEPPSEDSADSIGNSEYKYYNARFPFYIFTADSPLVELDTPHGVPLPKSFIYCDSLIEKNYQIFEADCIKEMKLSFVKLRRFLSSNGIKTKNNEWIHRKDFSGGNLKSFFQEIFPKVLSLIPDTHQVLVTHLKEFTSSAFYFFQEFEKAIDIFWMFNAKRKIKSFRSWQSKLMRLDVHLQDNEILAIEWGPTLEAGVFKEAVDKAKERFWPLGEKTRLVEIASFFKHFVMFQNLFKDMIIYADWKMKCISKDAEED